MAVAVLNKALEIDSTRRKSEMRWMADAIGHKVAEVVGRMLS